MTQVPRETASVLLRRGQRSVAMAPKLKALGRALRRRRGDLVWDGLVRGSGIVAVLGIITTMVAGPQIGGLVGFVVVTVWVNGPLGIFMPATYEPILMIFGRLYPPVLIGFTGIVSVVYVEFLSYHLHAKILHSRQLDVLREHPMVRRLIPLFRRAPFFTVWLCSWSPLPYWSVRILAPLAGYSVRRYLLATFLGRFPRFWFFAALGGLPIPSSVFVPIMVLAMGGALVLVFVRPLSRVIRNGGRALRMRMPEIPVKDVGDQEHRVATHGVLAP